MTKIDAINKVLSSDAPDNVKHCLATLLSEWETYQELKKQYPTTGLMNACYKNFGVKFMGMYGIETYQDVINKAYNF